MVISLQMQIQALPEELKRFSKILPENKKLKNWGCRSVQRPQVQSPVPLPKTPNTHTHTSTNIHLVGAKAVKYFLGTYCFQFVFLREKKQKKKARFSRLSPRFWGTVRGECDRQTPYLKTEPWYFKNPKQLLGFGCWHQLAHCRSIFFTTRPPLLYWLTVWQKQVKTNFTSQEAVPNIASWTFCLTE